jgi:hypothetical protein
VSSRESPSLKELKEFSMESVAEWKHICTLFDLPHSRAEAIFTDTLLVLLCDSVRNLVGGGTGWRWGFS